MQYKAKDVYTLYTLGTALLLIQSTKNWYRLDVQNVNNNNKKKIKINACITSGKFCISDARD